MKHRFEDFIDKIPKNIHNNTRSFLGKNIAVFIPDCYVMNQNLVNLDYHFVIFHNAPPIAMINNKEYQLKSGTLLCMAPGSDITVTAIRSKLNPQYVAINIKKDFLEAILMNISGSKKIEPIICDKHYSYKILDLIEFFMQEFLYSNTPARIMIESIETQIVIQLIRDMDLDPTVKKINAYQEKSYVDQAIKYIESYYSSNLTIQDICKTIYISPCHFQRIFKNATNKTPYQFLTELRIKKSKEKLLKDDMSITEIARLCGFLSSGHFSTIFKKNEGYTPTQYRKEKLKEM